MRSSSPTPRRCAFSRSRFKAVTPQPTLLWLTAAIANAESRVERQRKRLASGEAPPESESALELMELQLERLERQCLAIAARTPGPMH